jgi:hypothetical protein
MIDLTDETGALAHASVDDSGAVTCASVPNDRHAEVEEWLANELACRAQERTHG